MCGGFPGAWDRFDIYHRTGGRKKLFVAIAVGVAVDVAVSFAAVAVGVACGWQNLKYCRSPGLCPLSPASLRLAIDLPCSRSPSFSVLLGGFHAPMPETCCAQMSIKEASSRSSTKQGDVCAMAGEKGSRKRRGRKN